MYRDMRVAVVVPAHNEELLVGTVIATAPDLVDHVIVVDDASTDGTFQAAKSSTTRASRCSPCPRTRAWAAPSWPATSVPSSSAATCPS